MFQLFQIVIGIFPDTLEFVIVQKKMNHPVKMLCIICADFIKSNEKQIIEIIRLNLKFRDNRNLQFPLSFELITKEKGICTILIIFFCHLVASFKIERHPFT